MQKLVNYTKQYIGVISIVLAVCILLTYTFSSFIVSTGKKKVAEMYIGQLKYSMTIEGESTNTLIVLPGETIVDVELTSLNSIDTRYKLLYEDNENVVITYYQSTKDTDEVVTDYSGGGGFISANSTLPIKLRIMNNYPENQIITFKASGGYTTNTLDDVDVPEGYTEIATVEQTKSNTYFCKTSDKLIHGLDYVNGQYTYEYRNKGTSISWQSTGTDTWGIKITDKTSTDPVTSKVCTYINNKPVQYASYMFYNSNATSIDISGFDTRNVKDMQYMFKNSAATEIKGYDGFNTSNVTNMESMFSDTKITSIDVSSYDTSNVTDMSSIFASTAATTINGYEKFDTNKVTDMGSMFYETKISSIDVSNYNTSKVTSMAAMFYSSAATTINGYEKFDTNKVTSMGFMFYKTKISSIDVSNFNTSNVTDMDAMFYETAATTIKGLENFKTNNVTRMASMFKGAKVSSINLISFDTSKVTDMSNMFLDTAATSISGLDGFNTSAVTNMRGMFDGSNVSSIDVSSFDTSNVTNMWLMFGNSAATSISGLDGFDTSNVTNMRGMFQYTNVTVLDLSSFNTSNVTNMINMFYGSSKITKIYASANFKTDNVTDSSGMFSLASKVVGGSGTKYVAANPTDKTYAHIDGGTSNPGYFTAK